MCMNCGCGVPDDRHGDPANITAADLQRAGDANGQSLAETVRNIAATQEQMEGKGGRQASDAPG